MKAQNYVVITGMIETNVSLITPGPSGSPALNKQNSLNPGYKILSKTTAAKKSKTIPTGGLASASATIVRSRSAVGTPIFRHSSFNDQTGKVDPDWAAEFAEIAKEVLDPAYRRATRPPSVKELQLAA